MKRGLIFGLFLLMGLILGNVLTEIANNVSWLSFLTYGKQIGIGAEHPVTIDLAVIRLSFGLSIQMNLAVVLCLIGSLIFYSKVGKNI